jgi:hypothetical protein
VEEQWVGMERQSLDLLAKASASPEGEKATAWTQPPEGEENSPQTVLKGSLLPQTVGSGLHASTYQPGVSA